MKTPQVVVLCGGLGTRLREETEFRPKPMVEVGGRPILWHIMKIYAHYGYKDFILCLGYKGEIIKEYFYNYEALNNDFTITLGGKREVEIHNAGEADESGWRVTLADTGRNALKGARIKRVERFVYGDHFLLTYGDGIADIDLDRLIAFHKKHKRIATVTGVRPLSRFGELLVEDGRVRSFVEKPQLSHGRINGGFFVFDRRLFGYLADDDNCDFERGALERLAREGELMVFEHAGGWECMDTFRDVEYLNNLWKNGQAFWKVWEKGK